MIKFAKKKICCLISENRIIVTRKLRLLSYRKDDCAMCPIYGCTENFRQSLSTPMDTFPEIFNGLLFQSIL